VPVVDQAKIIAEYPGHDEARVLTAWRAAEGFVAARCRWPMLAADGVTPLDPPDELRQAVMLLTSRYLARWNSPDGLVGAGELGPVRVATVDRDVSALIAPWRTVVFG